ncbi:Metal-response element-binding transcription factor 2 [Trichoplax sp. H2]|nr:Metal-response element-binding transcription factor 2 [Trichoplax sp. H2]|eukprot:RDD42331.1 Metal-response element-binding transcription factor 2 [Trichoplax sp. H2]
MDGNKAEIKSNLQIHHYQIGDHVLVHWRDGMYYLGNVRKVNKRDRSCLVEFEDASIHSARYHHLHPELSKEACKTCHGEVSEVPNLIVICDNCDQGYHQKCHIPQVSDSLLKPDIQWICRYCIFGSAMKAGGALKHGPKARALQVLKSELPYEISTLRWDKSHLTNSECLYCYCGGPGLWFNRMVQCCRCSQWFHEACLQCLDGPLLLGDRYCIFTCSVCRKGLESYVKLPIDMEDYVHLSLYNLTRNSKHRYFDIENSIIPFMDNNKQYVKLDKKYLDVPLTSLVRLVYEILKKHLHDKYCMDKSAKRYKSWGLRMLIPPLPTSKEYEAHYPPIKFTDHKALKATMKTRKSNPKMRIMPKRLCSERTLLENNEDLADKGNLSQGGQLSKKVKRQLNHENKIVDNNRPLKRKRKGCRLSSSNTSDMATFYQKRVNNSVEYIMAKEVNKKGRRLHSYKKCTVSARRITCDGEVQYLFHW